MSSPRRGLVDDGVYALLRDRGVALCIVQTKGWRARRLRPSSRQPAGVISACAAKSMRTQSSRRVAAQVKAQSWSDAYAFFKHEQDGTAPVFARRLHGNVAGASQPLSTDLRRRSTGA